MCFNCRLSSATLFWNGHCNFDEAQISEPFSWWAIIYLNVTEGRDLDQAKSIKIFFGFVDRKTNAISVFSEGSFLANANGEKENNWFSLFIIVHFSIRNTLFSTRITEKAAFCPSGRIRSEHRCEKKTSWYKFNIRNAETKIATIWTRSITDVWIRRLH